MILCRKCNKILEDPIHGADKHICKPKLKPVKWNNIGGRTKSAQTLWQQMLETDKKGEKEVYTTKP